jgi:cell division protein DivIC
VKFDSFFKAAKNLNKKYLLYGSISLIFLVWMVFLDTHSWFLHSELNQEIEQLENEQRVLQKIITEDQKTIETLKNNDSLERFARENYGHKKDNETIFIIESKDSLR